MKMMPAVLRRLCSLAYRNGCVIVKVPFAMSIEIFSDMAWAGIANATFLLGITFCPRLRLTVGRKKSLKYTMGGVTPNDVEKRRTAGSVGYYRADLADDRVDMIVV